jgi:hypothetical protein
MYQPKSLLQISAEQLVVDSKTYNATISKLNLKKEIKDIIKTNIFYNKVKVLTKFVREYSKYKKESILLSGDVQSGKTNEMLGYCWWSIFVAKKPVIMLVRNFKIDLEQLIERVEKFNSHIIGKRNKVFHLKIDCASKATCFRRRYILAGLANFSQVGKILDLVRETRQQFHLCLDEADYAVKSIRNTSRLEKKLKYVEKYAVHTLRATATQFAVLIAKRDLTKILKMKQPANYFGLKCVKPEYIKYPKNLKIAKNPHLDPNIDIIYNKFVKKERGIILHLVTKTKVCHTILLNEIASRFSSLTVLSYNGDGVCIRTNSDHDDHYLALPYDIGKSYEIVDVKRKSGDYKVHRFQGYQINEILQILKEDTQSHTHISIISGNMTSRGISVVSSDYKWHLTDQYFNPSDFAHGETIIQSLRLLGCYNDNISITLWCTRQIWLDIKEQYSILSKCIDRCKTNDGEKAYKKIQKIVIVKPRRKLTRPGIMRGVGMVDKRIDDGVVKISLNLPEIVLEPDSDTEEPNLK